MNKNKHLSKKEIKNLFPIISSIMSYEKYTDEIKKIHKQKLRLLWTSISLLAIIGITLLVETIRTNNQMSKVGIIISGICVMTLIIIATLYVLKVIIGFYLKYRRYMTIKSLHIRGTDLYNDHQFDRLKFKSILWTKIKKLYNNEINNPIIVLLLDEIESIVKEKINQKHKKSISQTKENSPLNGDEIEIYTSTVEYIYSLIENAFKQVTENNRFWLDKLNRT